MPYKFHDAHRHDIPKAKYRVRNWPAYNAGLCRRGFDHLVAFSRCDGWLEGAEARGPRWRVVFGRRDRGDAEAGRGLSSSSAPNPGLHPKVCLIFLAWIFLVASAATLCRRRKALSIEPSARVSSEPLDLVLDSTGLKTFGQGEWCRAKHGRKPRGWKKVHIGLDAKSGMIVSHLMTDQDAGDPDQVSDILAQIDGPVGRFMADGAYDGEPVYDAVKRHSPGPVTKVVIPPRKTAVLSSEIDEEQTDRDRHILELEAKGRMAWQKAHDYGRRSLVETTMGRYKSIIGDRLHARHDEAQPVELAIGIEVLNRMTNLAKPVSVRVG